MPRGLQTTECTFPGWGGNHSRPALASTVSQGTAGSADAGPGAAEQRQTNGVPRLQQRPGQVVHKPERIVHKPEIIQAGRTPTEHADIYGFFAEQPLPLRGADGAWLWLSFPDQKSQGPRVALLLGALNLQEAAAMFPGCWLRISARVWETEVTVTSRRPWAVYTRFH